MEGRESFKGFSPVLFASQVWIWEVRVLSCVWCLSVVLCVIGSGRGEGKTGAVVREKKQDQKLLIVLQGVHVNFRIF